MLLALFGIPLLALLCLPLLAAVGPSAGAPSDAARSSFLLSAQETRETAAVTGDVTRAADGAAISGAEVRFLVAGRTFVTDISGVFLVRTMTPGTDTIEVALDGRTMERSTVRLLPGRLTVLSIELELPTRSAVAPLPRVEPVPVEELEVAVERAVAPKLRGFEERQSRRRGQFLTRADIQDAAAGRPSDLLRYMHGVRVEEGAVDARIWMGQGARACSPEIFLDGSPIRAVRLDDFLPEHIEAVEVYTRFGQAPPRYRERGCGSILVWTRETLKNDLSSRER